MKNELLRTLLLCFLGAGLLAWTSGCDLGTYGRRFEENKAKYQQRENAENAAALNQ